MFEILTLVVVVAGVALISRVAATLGAGSTGWIDGLLVSPPMPARPRGTQETDLPPFVFRDATSA